MIREFFNPRVALVFFVLWALFAAGLYLWIKSPRTKHRRWLRQSRVPAIAATLAALMCVVVVIVLSFL